MISIDWTTFELDDQVQEIVLAAVVVDQHDEVG